MNGFKEKLAGAIEVREDELRKEAMGKEDLRVYQKLKEGGKVEGILTWTIRRRHKVESNI